MNRTGSWSGFAMCAMSLFAACTSEAPARVATPTFSPGGGSYATPQDVALSCATSGAVIRYTVDGSTPTAASPAYSTAIHVAASETIKAYAIASGKTDSAVSSAAYVIASPAQAAAPAFSPAAGTYSSAQAVTISTASTGASIYYTIDGNTPTISSTLYSAPVNVAASETLKAIASGGGFTDSAVASAAYVITQPAAAAPGFSPGAGTYSSPQTVTISSPTAGAQIHYTTDGSTPTTSSTLYSAPVQVSESSTLTAIATAAGYSPSAPASAAYVITVAAPAAPTGLSVGAGDAQLTATWTSISGLAYNLYYSTTSGAGAGGTKLAGVTSPHAITGLTNGTTYYLVVTAVSSGGESPPSSEVSGTPQAPVSYPILLSPNYADPTTGASGGRSTWTTASRSGRFVAFQSQSTDLIASDANPSSLYDVYLRDTCIGASGCTPSTTLVSVNAAGTQCHTSSTGFNGSYSPSITADGRFVAFLTDDCYASASPTAPEIALRDTCITEAGPVASCTPSTALVSVGGGGDISGDQNTYPRISRDGRYVVWGAKQARLVIDLSTNGAVQVYLRDLCVSSGAAVSGCTAQTLLVSATAKTVAGAADSDAFKYDVADTGAVVFESAADNLVANPTLTAGAQPAALFGADCSAPTGGLCPLAILSIVPGTGSSTTGTVASGEQPSISADGRIVAFVSDLQLGAGAPDTQVVALDTCTSGGAAVSSCTPAFSYVSVDQSGNTASGGFSASFLSLSGDGRFVEFACSKNLSPSFRSGNAAYVRDTCLGAASCTPSTALVSLDQGQQDGSVFRSGMSGDGHFVVFDQVFTTNLTPLEAWLEPTTF